MIYSLKVSSEQVGQILGGLLKVEGTDALVREIREQVNRQYEASQKPDEASEVRVSKWGILSVKKGAGN